MTPLQEVAMVLVVAAIAAFVATALVFSRRQLQKTSDVWRAFAQRNGFRFTERTGPWYRRRGPMIAGSLDGVELRLDRFVVSSGKQSVVYTRVRGELERSLEQKLVVCRRDWIHRLRYAFGPPAVETGSPTFDARMMLLSDSRDAALELIDGEVRAQLLAFDRRLEIKCEKQEATLVWRAAERDPHVLEAGCRVIAALCRPHTALTSSAARARALGP
jgi:hypothetical protein